jgi:hypothetical protein
MVKDTMDYIRRELGAEAKQYIIKKLRDGKTYSQRVVSNLKLESGLVHTYLPRGLSDDDLLSFEHVVPHIDHMRTLQYIVDYINTNLSATEGKLVISEDANGSRGDEWLSRTKTNIAYHKDEVYHTLLGKPVDTEVIHDLISWSHTSWQNVLFLASLPVDTTIVGISEISDDLMSVLADRTEVVIVDAYDFDAYLIWEISDPTLQR